MDVRRYLVVLSVFAVCMLVAAPAWAQGRRLAGSVRAYQAETPHPYPSGTEERMPVWQDRIISPGATFIRVHFTGLDLGPGDFVSVSSPDGSQVWTYTGRGPHGNGRVWAFAIEGEEAIVTLHGGPGRGHGYRIDAIGHGAIPLRGRPGPTAEVVCGIDAREDVACHTSDTAFNAAQEPVARLLFASGGFLYVCTGWLVDGSAPNTLMTNNHCISTQRETESLQASFSYQRAQCNTGSINTPTNFAGGTLLKTNNVDRRGSKEGLDYTLLTLLGNPESNWSELVPSATSPSAADRIWFIQHPGGNEKKVGYYQDVVGDPNDLCRVEKVGQTYGRSAAGSQVAYRCDSEGGSSGSPIIDPLTGRAIALHHFGGVENNPCLNSGTDMADICADAGSLLNCTGGGGNIGGQCTLLPKGSLCTSGDQCCSGNCKGKPGSQTCK